MGNMKLVLWIAIFVLTFAGMIAGFYFGKEKILAKTQNAPFLPRTKSHAAAATADTTYDSPMDSLAVVIDGLVAQLSNRIKEIQKRDATIKGLNEQVAALKNENERLKQQMAAMENLKTLKAQHEQRIQDVSKTISSMKVEVLAPILANLPDEVVAIIYDKAKAKDRAKIFSALPPERSGRIVRQIAGEPVEEAAQ